MSALLLAVLVATGIAAQIFWASASSHSPVTAAMSIARTAANAEAASSAGGGSGSAETLYARGDGLRPWWKRRAGRRR